MIYTIGYEHLCPADLATIARALQARVIDVRSRPSGRVKRGFSRDELDCLLGGISPGGHNYGYVWWGDVLGGRGAGVTENGLASLMGHDRDGARLLLLCQEAAPGDCHRHHAIAMPLAARGVTVVHLYEDEAFTATALQRALDDEDPEAAYDYITVAELLAGEMPPT